MTRTFRVKPLPCGTPVAVSATTVLEAARTAGAEVALVERCAPLDEGVPDKPLVVSSAGYLPAVHFVGFRGEEYWSAVRVFGLPDVYHRVWDQRAQREIGEHDTVIFAKYGPDWRPSPYNYDDSNEDDDPAARERR